jgi:hypothetical protein
MNQHCRHSIKKIVSQADANRRCRSCGPADETIDHVLQCAASPPRKQFHDEQRTHPLLHHILREAMHQWFAAEASSITAASPVLFPTDEHRLLRQKNEIGWQQIFKGRFSTNKWQWIQNDYYYQHWKNTKYKQTGIRWRTNFILAIWELWYYEVCELRNA